MFNFNVPGVMKCMYFRAPSPGWQTRPVNDYEFDLYMGSERDMYIDDKFYKISKGSLVFRKPGQTVTAYGDYDAYMITLDFTGENNIPPELYHRGFAPTKPRLESSMLDIIPDVFIPTHLEELASLLKRITANSYPNIVNPDVQRSCVTEFLLLVLSDSIRYQRESAAPQAEKHDHITKACSFINKNFASPISTSDIAQYTALNKNYLIRLFSKHLGMTPNRYIVETRLYHARHMTIQTTLPIKVIASSCGFASSAYFIQCFKARYGLTPGEYRETFGNLQSTEE